MGYSLLERQRIRRAWTEAQLENDRQRYARQIRRIHRKQRAMEIRTYGKDRRSLVVRQAAIILTMLLFAIIYTVTIIGATIK